MRSHNFKTADDIRYARILHLNKSIEICWTLPPFNTGSGGGSTIGPSKVRDYRIDSIIPTRTVYDENTGELHDPKLVGEARALEFDTIDKLGVWRVGPRPPKGPPTKVLKDRWVYIDKGALYRSRCVAMEIECRVKSVFAPELFAAMPPFVPASAPDTIVAKLVLCSPCCARRRDSESSVSSPSHLARDSRRPPLRVVPSRQSRA